MKRISYKNLVKKIPSRVEIKSKIFYDVVWQQEIVDSTGRHLYGLSDPNSRVIVIKMGMPARLTIETYLHELTHSFSEVFNLNLTETQVLAMEHTLPWILKENNIFKKEE